MSEPNNESVVVRLQMVIDALEVFCVRSNMYGIRVGFSVKPAGIHVVVYLPTSWPNTATVEKIIEYLQYNKCEFPLLFVKEVEFTPEEALKL